MTHVRSVQCGDKISVGRPGINWNHRDSLSYQQPTIFEW